MSRQREWIVEETVRPAPAARGPRRFLYLALAAVFLGLGLLGAILPGLPTTPFLLLMSYFLARSSPRLHARVIRLPIVGGPLRDWQAHQGVRPQVKIAATAMVLAVVATTLLFSDWPAAFRAAIVALAALGLFVVWRLPTVAIHSESGVGASRKAALKSA